MLPVLMRFSEKQHKTCCKKESSEVSANKKETQRELNAKNKRKKKEMQAL
jgi:hypothetical protein